MSKRIVLVGLLLVVTAVAAQWPEYRGGAHRAGVESGGPPTELTELWRSEHRVGWQSVAMGEFAYFAEANHVVAINLQTGEAVWQRSAPQVFGAIVENGLVLASTMENKVMAWDAVSGEPEWAIELTSHPSTPAVAGSAAFVTTYDGSLVRLNALTGSIQWSKEIPEGSSGPMIAGMRLLVADQANQIHIFGFDGSMKSVIATNGTSRGLAYGDGFLVVLSDHLRVSAYRDGKLLWSRENVIPGTATPVYSDGTLYLHGHADSFHALDASTGSTRWELPPHSYMVQMRSSSAPPPAQADSESGLPGKPPDFNAPPVAGEGLVAIATLDGFLMIVAADNGAVIEEHELSGRPLSGPSARGPILIVPLDSGLVAFHGTPHEATHTRSEESATGPAAVLAVFAVCLGLAARRN